MLMKSTKKIALAGIFTALCVVFLFIGSLFQTLDLSAAAVGSIIVLITFIELGNGWAFGVYAAASILSMLLLPNKTAAIVFTVFAGFYPIVKVWLNKIKPFALSFTVRIVCFNAMLTALIFVAKRFLGLEEDYLNFGVIIYALCNIAFIAYDFALERIAITYNIRIRPKIFGRKY